MPKKLDTIVVAHKDHKFTLPNGFNQLKRLTFEGDLSRFIEKHSPRSGIARFLFVNPDSSLIDLLKKYSLQFILSHGPIIYISNENMSNISLIVNGQLITEGIEELRAVGFYKKS